MAKDGTNRGGARAGAGRKKKALADKISEGKTAKVTVLPTVNLKGMEMPAPKEYLKAPPEERAGKLRCGDLRKDMELAE